MSWRMHFLFDHVCRWVIRFAQRAVQSSQCTMITWSHCGLLVLSRSDDCNSNSSVSKTWEPGKKKTEENPSSSESVFIIMLFSFSLVMRGLFNTTKEREMWVLSLVEETQCKQYCFYESHDLTSAVHEDEWCTPFWSKQAPLGVRRRARDRWS